jgi:muramoyltetrapeptide carboxypeptidase LdcA involved in peptidoglycan recycling
MIYKKPQRLQIGDSIAVLSPSWGGPGLYPHIYQNGLSFLNALGLKTIEYPTARAANEFLYTHPEARAKDINDAFADERVKAVFASIGGNDSVRILPFLNKEIVQNNPKIIMGYSDTSTLLTYLNQLGIVTFHGPSVMAGLSQGVKLPTSFTQHVKDMLFSAEDCYVYHSYGLYCDGYPGWADQKNTGMINPVKYDEGWRFIQGAGKVTGQLFGGCMEVLEMLNGTDYWPVKDYWNDRILFFETSEEKPSVGKVGRMLRNYGMQGIFGKVKAILFGRARDYTIEEKAELDQMIIKIVKGEFSFGDMPIVTNMDFGHTDPQFILPLGVKAELDCVGQTFRLVEAALT